jgi:hypothetical protein
MYYYNCLKWMQRVFADVKFDTDCVCPQSIMLLGLCSLFILKL